MHQTHPRRLWVLCQPNLHPHTSTVLTWPPPPAGAAGAPRRLRLCRLLPRQRGTHLPLEAQQPVKQAEALLELRCVALLRRRRLLLLLLCSRLLFDSTLPPAAARHCKGRLRLLSLLLLLRGCASRAATSPSCLGIALLSR